MTPYQATGRCTRNFVCSTISKGIFWLNKTWVLNLFYKWPKSTILCPQVTPLTNAKEQSLYFKSEILENALRVLKKNLNNSQKSETH